MHTVASAAGRSGATIRAKVCCESEAYGRNLTIQNEIDVQNTGKFRQFVGLLERAMSYPTWDGPQEQDVARLLDGAASEAARTLLTPEVRQCYGIFFSGHTIGARVAECLAEPLRNGASVFDPTCGAGDLLLAAARHLPLGKTLQRTINIWTDRIGGTDVHPEFVLAARMRLLLLAQSLHKLRGDAIPHINFTDKIFVGVKVADYLANPDLGCEYDCIIANPPFGDTVAPKGCSWSTGKTQLAAVFVDEIVNRAKGAQTIVAILPDVLRSGTRYARWRDHIAGKACEGGVIPYGRFDSYTDVDVFILNIKSRFAQLESSKMVWPSIVCESNANNKSTRLGDRFSVRIGPVVPHRHTNVGNWRPYVCVKSAPPFSETEAKKKRRFKGAVFSPPFVLLRRTSNPMDENRLIPTIVVGKEPVAVENHLIVIMPLVGGLLECRELYQHLITKAAREWIDGAIRCRHLTKRVLLEMPLPTE